MMGNMGGMMNMMHSGGIWFINGVAAEGHVMDPMLTLARDRSHVIAMTNATAWHHPIHLHGHSFRVISHSQPTRRREWQDTVSRMWQWSIQSPGLSAANAISTRSRVDISNLRGPEIRCRQARRARPTRHPYVRA